MDRLVARHRMKSVSGRLYLASQLRDARGVRRLELPDGSPLEHVGGPLYRLVESGEILREIGVEISVAEGPFD